MRQPKPISQWGHHSLPGLPIAVTAWVKQQAVQVSHVRPLTAALIGDSGVSFYLTSGSIRTGLRNVLAGKLEFRAITKRLNFKLSCPGTVDRPLAHAALA